MPGASLLAPRLLAAVGMIARRAGQLAVAAVLSSVAALGYTTACLVERTPGPFWENVHRRYFEDVRIGMGFASQGEFPVYALPQEVEDPDWLARPDPELPRLVSESKLRPWPFWTTLPAQALASRSRIQVARRFDDAGRPLLLGLGFRALGGLAPFLCFWLGLLAFVPILSWLAWELVALGRVVAASVFVLLLGASPFVADVLALSYSTVGFYMLGLASLVPLAAYACLSPAPSARGLIARAIAAGLALGVCLVCRSGGLLQLCGYALALAIGVHRAATGRRGRLTFVACALALVGPYLAIKAAADGLAERTFRAHAIEGRPQQHAFWLGIWTGLGDFDRTKGYRWRDRTAGAAVEAAGGPTFTYSYYDEASEPFLRALVLRDIRQDPLWYAGILAKRALATLSLRRLWPWPPLSGLSVQPSRSMNEGVIDKYYRLTATADTFGVGRLAWEAPVPLLLLPAGLLFAWWLRTRRARLLGELGVLACLAAAALALPVLVTTASALEMQCFMLVYLLGAAFAADAAVEAAGYLRRR